MFRGTDTLVAEPPNRDLQFSIVVPARNEEDLLPSCLRALAEQKTLSGGRVSHEMYEVILLINNTTDRSRQVAESFRHLYPSFRLHIAERTFSKSKAHIGHVRRLLMDEACARLEMAGHPSGAILSTDADSEVASNWIARNQEELAKGVEAVGGRVILPTCEKEILDPTTRELYRYDHLYRRLVCWIENRYDPEPHDPWPRHHQHFAASLAVKVETYKTVGRLPPRRCFEDIAFYGGMIRRDIRLRHSNKVKVFTSARLAGRTRAGLSTQLSDWAKRGRNVLRVPVESAAFLEHMFAVRSNLRVAWSTWRSGKQAEAALIHQISANLGITQRRLIAEVRAARYFGVLLEQLRFYESCRNMWPDWIRLAPLKNVVDELQAEFKASQDARQSVSTNGHSRSVHAATGSNPLERA